jgi:hypothetical protein
MAKRRYSDFASSINVDAFEEAIGFEVIKTDNNENDIGHCPDLWGLHKNGDTTGKFAIKRDKKVYNCWVCGGGSLLSLAMSFTGLDEQAATDWLHEFASEDAVSDESFLDEIDRLLYAEIKRDPPMPYFNERVLAKLRPAYEWGHEKGIRPEVIDICNVKSDPEAVRRSSKGDYTGPAIVFPHYWEGRLVGWQSRWLDENRPKWIPKYTNTSDFPRDNTLYNYEREYFSEEVVVCESVPTVLVLASYGIPAICTFGSNVTERQMRLMRLCVKGLVIAPDNDEPGTKYVESLCEGLDRYIPIKIAPKVGEPGSGDDLGDLQDPEDIVDALSAAEYF